jgi:hypothetical protein
METKKSTVVRKKTTSNVLTLRNIKPVDIEKKYQLYNHIGNGLTHNQPTNTTNITTIVSEAQIVSFIDESKRPRDGIVSMIDMNTHQNISKTMGTYHCYWDRNSFSNQPIGCPVRYIPNKASLLYKSHINTESHVIRSDINTNRLSELDKTDIVIDKNDYYETDGIFCSFNCCQAFIEDNYHNPIYKYSKALLLDIYNTIFSDNNIRIISSAPHWRLLQEYGGHFSILKYRDSFNAKSYTNHGIIKLGHSINVLSLGMMFEESINIQNELQNMI